MKEWSTVEEIKSAAVWRNRSSEKCKSLDEVNEGGGRLDLAVLFLFGCRQKGKGQSEIMRRGLMDTAAAGLICSNTVVTSR